MDYMEAAEIIEKHLHCWEDFYYCCCHECGTCRYHNEPDDFREALNRAVSALNHLRWEDEHEEERE